jgi:hypothetical protein
MRLPRLTFSLSTLLPLAASAGIGDPQLKTDHDWYPGELAISDFDRLADTQAALWKKVTGKEVESDEDRVLASWFWRNIHFAHGEEGRADLFGQGFESSDWTRDYWTGLFAHGFALCGTTHAQWTAEFQHLLGHARSRATGVTGHNSFEVFLTGGAYGEGRWALLDHDLSTVVFNGDGTRLISIDELASQLEEVRNADRHSPRQRGWRISGLHDGDLDVFTSVHTAEYLSGYAGPPPKVHLRHGESFRRYLSPGLEDGKTHVFWGRNYRQGIPGPERSRTWVNQPEKMHRATATAPYRVGQFRFGNAVFTYRPEFAGGRYREAVVDESDEHVTFEFSSPYVIGATPPDDSDWGIYKDGCTNGLTVRSNGVLAMQLSTDRGRSWKPAAGSDLTDLAKGHQQYWLRIQSSPADLAAAGLEITTVCQANPATMPRLRDGNNRITFAASGQAHLSAGPNLPQALAHLASGEIDASGATLKLQAPRGNPVTQIHAASHNISGNPPNPDTTYLIETSTDGGSTWQPLTHDWRITRRGQNPENFWSQSFTYGSAAIPDHRGPVLVRFSNSAPGRKFRRIEAHATYQVPQSSSARVTFAWTSSDRDDVKTSSHNYRSSVEDGSWSFDAGPSPQTLWVEIAAE